MSDQVLWSQEGDGEGYVIVHKKGDPAPAESLIREHKALLAAYRWIPVTERLPYADMEVLVCDVKARHPRAFIAPFTWKEPYGMENAFFDPRGFMIDGDEHARGWTAGEITHWMAIPELPK